MTINNLCFAIMIFGFLFVLLIIELVVCSSVYNGFEKKLLCICSTISVVLILCCWWQKIIANFCIAVCCYLSYFVFILLVKFVISKVDFKKISDEKSKKTKQLEKFQELILLNSQLFLISPDFGLTKFFKDVYRLSEDDNRKKLIQHFNFWNVIITSTYVLFLFMFSHFDWYSSFIIYALPLLGVRIVSRTIEIVISFVRDICSESTHSSTLTCHNRIVLAFASIAEVVVLTFGVGFCGGIKASLSISKAACQALMIINSLGDSNYFDSGVNIAKLFCGLACFALLGIVIGSYIGGNANINKMAKNNFPQLFVMDANGICNSLSFEKGSDPGIFELTFVNSKGCSYVIYDRGEYLHLPKSCIDNKTISVSDNSDNFKLEGHVFKIRYDANCKNNKVKIELL